MTEPDFWKKIWFRGYGPKRGQNGPNSDPFQFFSKSSLTIFLVFCMQIDFYKGLILHQTACSAKFRFRGYGPKRGQNGPNSDPFQFFSRCSLTIFLVFCMQIDFYKGLILQQTTCSAKFRFQGYGPKRGQDDPKRGQNGPNSDPFQIFVIKSFIEFPDVMHVNRSW